ncbi:BMP family ABC transporter substrate-binding protein [Moorella sulfitireducens]|uniref:BMP family ABC transporter substrate-binding protein n=1 Tax=Neomoorella sulfitireducens TaxID=2972948 RepID=UPI0021AB9AE2|nr:BMP family ABC transporter substrate-binding protein [Moorella sulfitireducens]
MSVVAILAIGLVSGCGGGKVENTSGDKGQSSVATENKEEPFKVAFMYVGPIGDAGWTYAHDQGRKEMERELSWVKTSFIENVPEGADAERTLTELAEKGNKVIFATSFGYMDYVLKVAEKYPQVVFLNCAHFKSADNVGNYYGRMYQPRYLSGIIAGKMTKTNIIGYVASHPIPEVIRGINALALGVRSVNPQAVVKVVWTNTWYDPAAEKQAALSLLDVGADVIAENQDTPAPMIAAQERGAYGIGNNTDMSSFAPKAVLTTPIFHWGKYYTQVVKEIKEGKQWDHNYWGSMKDGVVDLAPYGPMVPDDVKQLVEAKKKEIMDGTWDVFTGPIKDQSGKIRVPEGQRMSDADMLQFDWFVEGVEGEIPK